MASITRKSGEARWQARYRDPAGRERSKRFDRKLDAQRWLDDVTASLTIGTYVDPRDGRILVTDYAREWESSLVNAIGSARIVDNALRLHLLPVIGELPCPPSDAHTCSPS